MDTTPISFAGTPPPPFPGPHRTIDFSPLEFILGLLAVITIPALIYTFFFAIKCPPNPFRGRRRLRSSDSLPATGNAVGESITKGVASDVKYRKDEPVKGVDSECPVCLSAFSDGEEVRQLSGCKHSFHGPCIDKWLNSHSNCPVCRAFVPVKRPSSSSSSAARDADSHQGLPDASSLV